MRNIDNFIFGDIVLADLPFTDRQGTKIRPVLIISKDQNDYLIMKITSVIKNKESIDLEIDPDNFNKLLEKSVFKTKKISHYSKEILQKKIGSLSENDKKLVKDKLLEFVQNL